MASRKGGLPGCPGLRSQIATSSRLTGTRRWETGPPLPGDGGAAFRSGDNPGAIEWAELALAHAERLAEPAGDPQLLFPCYDGLGTLYLDQEDEARAEQYM